MKTTTNLKVGGLNLNHNETLRGVAMKTTVRAGGNTNQHNETMGGLKMR